jgi:hypothetical protein
VPGVNGYFAANGAPGDVTDQNVLWGTWLIVNAANGYTQGSDMIAIVADATEPAISRPGHYTFYGRYVGWSAVDHRAPLATTFGAQFGQGGPFSAGTDLLVWRDSKVAQAAFACPATPGQRPAWFPIGQEALVLFDEQEHPEVPVTCPFGAPSQPAAAGSALPTQCPPTPAFLPFPAATQRVHVGGAALPVPFTFGWLYLDMNFADSAVTGNVPPADPLAAQAWIVATRSSNGRFAVATDAFRLDSACAPNHFAP